MSRPRWTPPSMLGPSTFMPGFTVRVHRLAPLPSVADELPPLDVLRAARPDLVSPADLRAAFPAHSAPTRKPVTLALALSAASALLLFGIAAMALSGCAVKPGKVCAAQDLKTRACVKWMDAPR